MISITTHLNKISDLILSKFPNFFEKSPTEIKRLIVSSFYKGLDSDIFSDFIGEFNKSEEIILFFVRFNKYGLNLIEHKISEMLKKKFTMVMRFCDFVQSYKINWTIDETGELCLGIKFKELRCIKSKDLEFRIYENIGEYFPNEDKFDLYNLNLINKLYRTYLGVNSQEVKMVLNSFNNHIINYHNYNQLNHAKKTFMRKKESKIVFEKLRSDFEKIRGYLIYNRIECVVKMLKTLNEVKKLRR